MVFCASLLTKINVFIPLEDGSVPRSFLLPRNSTLRRFCSEKGGVEPRNRCSIRGAHFLLWADVGGLETLGQVERVFLPSVDVEAGAGLAGFPHPGVPGVPGVAGMPSCSPPGTLLHCPWLMRSVESVGRRPGEVAQVQRTCAQEKRAGGFGSDPCRSRASVGAAWTC